MRDPKPISGLLMALPVLVLTVGGTAGYFAWKQKVGEGLDEAAKRGARLYEHSLSPDEVARVRRDVLEATSRALSWGKLREKARQTRIYLFLTTLDPHALRREAEAYFREQDGFSNKDPVFTAGQVLYDCWSVPAPDTVERRRVAEIKQPGFDFKEIDWYRPVLLKRFVAGKAACGRGAWEEAEEILAEVLRYAPDFAQAWYLRGRTRFELGRLSEALADFREAARLDSARPEPHRWAALALEKLGRKAEATAELRTALTKDAAYPEVREKLRDLESP